MFDIQIKHSQFHYGNRQYPVLLCMQQLIPQADSHTTVAHIFYAFWLEKIKTSLNLKFYFTYINQLHI